MSGINEIKKKTKISINEMFENQQDGNLETQKTGNPEKHFNGQQSNLIEPQNLLSNQHIKLESQAHQKEGESFEDELIEKLAKILQAQPRIS